MTLVTQAEFARLQGWQRSYVTQLKQQGRLVMVDGKVDVEASLAKIDALASPNAHHQARARQLEETRANKAKEEGKGDDANKEGIEALNLRLKKAEADKREYEADIARMDREQKAGNLVPREIVDYVLTDYAASLRAMLETRADRLAPIIHPLQTMEEVRAALAEADEAVLVEMAETMRRKGEQFDEVKG